MCLDTNFNQNISLGKDSSNDYGEANKGFAIRIGCQPGFTPGPTTESNSTERPTRESACDRSR